MSWDPPNGQNPPLLFYSAPPQPSGAVTGTVNTHALNVRTGPGIGYDILTQLVRGDGFSGIGRNGDASWGRIQPANNLTGWLSASYTDLTVNVFNVQVENAPPLPPTLPTG